MATITAPRDAQSPNPIHPPTTRMPFVNRTLRSYSDEAQQQLRRDAEQLLTEIGKTLSNIASALNAEYAAHTRIREEYRVQRERFVRLKTDFEQNKEAATHQFFNKFLREFHEEVAELQRSQTSELSRLPVNPSQTPGDVGTKFHEHLMSDIGSVPPSHPLFAPSPHAGQYAPPSPPFQSSAPHYNLARLSPKPAPLINADAALNGRVAGIRYVKRGSPQMTPPSTPGFAAAAMAQEDRGREDTTPLMQGDGDGYGDGKGEEENDPPRGRTRGRSWSISSIVDRLRSRSRSRSRDPQNTPSAPVAPVSSSAAPPTSSGPRKLLKRRRPSHSGSLNVPTAGGTMYPTDPDPFAATASTHSLPFFGSPRRSGESDVRPSTLPSPGSVGERPAMNRATTGPPLLSTPGADVLPPMPSSEQYRNVQFSASDPQVGREMARPHPPPVPTPAAPAVIPTSSTGSFGRNRGRQELKRLREERLGPGKTHVVNSQPLLSQYTLLPAPPQPHREAHPPAPPPAQPQFQTQPQPQTKTNVPVNILSPTGLKVPNYRIGKEVSYQRDPQRRNRAEVGDVVRGPVVENARAIPHRLGPEGRMRAHEYGALGGTGGFGASSNTALPMPSQEQQQQQRPIRDSVNYTTILRSGAVSLYAPSNGSMRQKALAHVAA